MKKLLSFAVVLIVLFIGISAAGAQSLDPCFYYGPTSPECVNYFGLPPQGPILYQGVCQEGLVWNPYVGVCIAPNYSTTDISLMSIAFMTGFLSQPAGLVIFSTIPVSALAEWLGVDVARAKIYQDCINWEVENNIPLSQSICHF